MTSIAVLIPVLNRPHRVDPLLESLESSSRFTKLVPVFLCSPGDKEQIDAVRSREIREPDSLLWEVMEWEAGAGDYAKKMNFGVNWLGGQFEFVFLAADDLVFHPGWAERALACHLETHACVIGTNDLGNAGVIAGNHSTHTLVHQEYVDCGTIDEPDYRKILHEGYDHNWVDVEFVQTAMARETWAHATDSIVEHAHPIWGKSDDDATYEKGQRAYSDDAALYESRRRLWEEE